MFAMEKYDGDARSTIFNVAARLFAEKGYNAVSMREISEASGLSKPTIYYYFGNKEGIYSELVKAGIDQFIMWVDKVTEMDISATEKLEKIACIYFKSAREYPDFTRLFIKLGMSMEKMDFLKHIEQYMENRKELGTEIVQEGMKKGEFRADVDPEIVAKMFGGTLVHYVLHYLGGDSIKIDDDLAHSIVDTFVRGLK